MSTTKNTQIYIGVTSGTSLDGADAVALAVTKQFKRVDYNVLDTHSVTFEPDLRAACLRLQNPSTNELHEAQLVALRLTDVYVNSIQGLLDKLKLGAEQITAVGVHGQTIRHRPELGFSVQLNQPARIAEQAQITVVSDFRARDIAAGGQGAPLAPAFHDTLWRSPQKNRVVLNIGGFANISVLNIDTDTFGFDTGPGNVLMDAWIARHQHVNYDCNGEWAALGKVQAELLNALLADPYFAQTYPKSTGREHFDLNWLEAKLAQCDTLEPADVQATLLELTARSVTNAIRNASPHCDEVIVAGGGAYNAYLMDALRAHLPCDVTDSEHYGIHPISVDGAAFAWLAYRTMTAQSGNLPAATGAHGTRILGSITPK